MKKVIRMLSLALMSVVSILLVSSCSQEDDIQEVSSSKVSSFDKADYETKLTILNSFSTDSVMATRSRIFVKNGIIYVRMARPQIRILERHESSGSRYVKAVAYPVDMELSDGKRLLGRLFVEVISDRYSTLIRYYNIRETQSTMMIYGDLYSHGDYFDNLYNGLIIIGGYSENDSRYFNLPNGIRGFSISIPAANLHYEMWNSNY